MLCLHVCTIAANREEFGFDYNITPLSGTLAEEDLHQHCVQSAFFPSDGTKSHQLGLKAPVRHGPGVFFFFNTEDFIGHFFQQ